MKLSVTKRGQKKYQSIKEYIIEKWGKNVADAFDLKTKHFFDLLEQFPELGEIEVPSKKIRGFQLTKQTRVFYRVKGERIIILTFFDTRENPKKKPK